MENIENEVRAIDDGEYVETVLETERFPATVWPKKAYSDVEFQQFRIVPSVKFDEIVFNKHFKYISPKLIHFRGV